MGALQLGVLLLGVSAVAAACGYAGSSLRRRNRRRSRVSFVVGFCCGSIASVVLRPSSILDACGKSVVALGAVRRERRRRQRVLAAVGRVLPR